MRTKAGAKSEPKQLDGKPRRRQEQQMAGGSDKYQCAPPKPEKRDKGSLAVEAKRPPSRARTNNRNSPPWKNDDERQGIVRDQRGQVQPSDKE